MRRTGETFLQALARNKAVPLRESYVLAVGDLTPAQQQGLQMHCRRLEKLGPMELEAPRFDPETFEVVIFVHSLPRIPTECMPRAISSAVALCKRGGYLIVCQDGGRGAYCRAEERFGVLEGGREARARARAAMVTHPGLTHARTFMATSKIWVSSADDFVASFRPASREGLEVFLERLPKAGRGYELDVMTEIFVHQVNP